MVSLRQTNDGIMHATLLLNIFSQFYINMFHKKNYDNIFQIDILKNYK